MTREEAIKQLKCAKAGYMECLSDEAIDMAIKALSAEPCEDCISRKDLIKSKFIIPENEYEKTWNDVLNSLYENLPSVQPISKSVIEDIKADIAEFMAKISALGNCKEGWHNAGQRIGLEQACEIIDNHIAESEE